MSLISHEEEKLNNVLTSFKEFTAHGFKEVVLRVRKTDIKSYTFESFRHCAVIEV